MNHDDHDDHDTAAGSGAEGPAAAGPAAGAAAAGAAAAGAAAEAREHQVAIRQRLGELDVVVDCLARRARWPWSWSWWHSPPARVHEVGEHMVVHVEVPGLRAEELRVELDAGVPGVLVKGEPRRDPGEVRAPAPRPGPLALWVPLPAGCQNEHVNADLADGVLTVRVPLPPLRSGRSGGE